MHDPIIMISGGFDPLHVGHLRMIKEAAEYGKVLVVINSDDWLKRKKRYNFMSWEDRAEIIYSYNFVWKVSPVDDKDNTVVSAIKEWKPDFFGNGGDRYLTNTPEKSICDELNIQMVWNLGGGKIRSSSTIVSRSHQESISFENCYENWKSSNE